MFVVVFLMILMIWMAFLIFNFILSLIRKIIQVLVSLKMIRVYQQILSCRKLYRG